VFNVDIEVQVEVVESPDDGVQVVVGCPVVVHGERSLLLYELVVQASHAVANRLPRMESCM